MADSPCSSLRNVAHERRIEAYVDEAGVKGLLRNLDGSTDAKIALLASIVIPKESRELFQALFLGPFERFKAARATGAGGLHITDAFGSGNEEWAAVAQSSRSEIVGIIRDLQIPVIYDARRLRVARKSYQLVQQIADAAYAQRQSNVTLRRRPSSERIEEQCMIGLAIKLDCLASDCGVGLVDIMTDQMDESIAGIFRGMMEQARVVGMSKERVTPGWDRAARQQVQGVVRISISDSTGRPLEWLAATHLGDLVVLGKDDSLVFAADVVVNSLHHHLTSLPPDAPLNHPSSVSEWLLGSRVYGAREDAVEDKI